MEVTRAVPAPTPKRRPAPQVRSRPRAAAGSDLAPPRWVTSLFGSIQPVVHRSAGAAQVSVRVTDAPSFTLVTARVARAAALDSSAFERCANDAYRAIAEIVQGRPHRHAVRFWNHIPDIRRTNERGLDRYMVFNAGRFDACSQWFGGPAAFDRLLPTASAVGHDGADLVVHALAGNDAGVAVENPRQVPSYR